MLQKINNENLGLGFLKFSLFFVSSGLNPSEDLLLANSL